MEKAINWQFAPDEVFRMGYQSESSLENKLIEQLVSKGYKDVSEVRSNPPI